VRPSTRAALLNHIEKQGPLRFEAGDDAVAEGRVTELLQLIVAAREYQFM
jgi:hypothetical protein